MIVVTLTWRVINFQALCSQTASRWRRFSVELPKLWRLLEIKSDLCPWKRLAQLKCFNHNSDVAHFVANCCYLQKYTKCNVTSVYTKLLGKISLFKDVTCVFWRHQRRTINRTMCPDVWSNQTNRHHEFTNIQDQTPKSNQIHLWYKKQLQSVNISFIHGFISLIRNLITEGNQRLNWICVRLTVI